MSEGGPQSADREPLTLFCVQDAEGKWIPETETVISYPAAGKTREGTLKWITQDQDSPNGGFVCHVAPAKKFDWTLEKKLEDIQAHNPHITFALKEGIAPVLPKDATDTTAIPPVEALRRFAGDLLTRGGRNPADPPAEKTP